MREITEFRIDEALAPMLFGSDEGVRVGTSVRRVALESGSPKFEQLGTLQRELRRSIGKPFFYGWRTRRKYAARELDSAALLHLKIPPVIGCAGEEYGTKYDESKACPVCGAGAEQRGPLIMDATRFPKSKDFAKSIAGEVIVSNRVAELFATHKIAGVTLYPVRTTKAKSLEPSGWWQLKASGSSAELVPPTRTGVDPFDPDPAGTRCVRGDTLGLNLLSELAVAAGSQGELDVVASRQYIGIRRGLLRPERSILISPRMYRLIKDEQLTGCEIEVVNLV